MTDMAPARKADPGRYIGRRYALLDYFSSGGFGGFFLCPVSCQQQQVSASNEVSCDGQTVAAVDLIASPKISIESLQPLVQQKTGEPYSSAKVDSGVSALRETGRFTKVAVEVKPDSGGLHVTFILEPVLYFGVFDFPGATKGFSYTRLLQVIDIPNQTPYKQDVVTKAEEHLRSFFVSAGYFQAQVQPEPQFDETHMLANVVFHVNLGKRAKLGNAEVRGPEPAEANRLLHATRSLQATARGASLKPGKSYTPKRIDAAIALMKRDLASHHHLASKVHLDQSFYHPETNHADIIIGARPGPIVKVRVMGAKLSWLPFLRGRQMKKLIPIFSEGTVDPDLVEEGRRNLIDFFQSKGYFGAKVTADFHNNSNVDLVYNVNRGSRYKVETVALRGNEHVDTRDLVEQVAVKPHRLLLSRGKFSDKLLHQSVGNITAFYKNRGYEDVKVDTDVVDRAPKIDVTFQITEGPQTVVDHLTIEGNTHISGLELAPKAGFALRPGQLFSPKNLSDDRSHIMAIYLDRGFLNSEFDSKVTPSPNDLHRVNVAYKITEKQQVHVDEVLLLGNKRTRPSLMKKTANVRDEAPLSEETLLAGESRLHDLGVFDWASIEPRRPITDQDKEDVLVKVHEAGNKEISYGFGLQVARRGGNLPSGTITLPGLPPITSGAPNFTAAEKTFVSPRGSIGFTRYNVRGLAETASISALVARLDQRALATYTQPHFRGSSWSSLYSASIERTTENPTFEARLANASWQLEKPLNKDKTRRIQLRYSFGKTDLSNFLVPGLVLPQDQHVRLSTLSATWIRDTRDKPLDASRGFYETLDLGITPKGPGGKR